MNTNKEREKIRTQLYYQWFHPEELNNIRTKVKASTANNQRL
jgi:hypothetical protein